MRDVLTGMAAANGILAICMGAGPTDFRLGAIIFAVFAGLFIALRGAIKEPA